MPKYTFKLWDDDGGVEDDIGVNLPDADTAPLGMPAKSSPK